MSSRSVKFRRASPNGYDHQRSDSGFSDCESRASNPEHDYLTPGFEDHGLYSIRQALDTARQESEKWRARAEEAEEKLKEVRNDFEQTKAHMRALTNEIEIANQAKDALTKTNKELVEQNAQLQETVKDLKKANRKSSGTSSPSASSATASESSDEKKVRRSSSKRRKDPSSRADKEKERDRERDKERDKERDRERRKESQRAHQEETDRLRKRFDTRGDESDAKSSTTATKSQRGRHESSYIEPLGLGAPRPQAPVPASPSRPYAAYPASTAPTTYSATPAYSSIRESYTGTTPRSLHPAVYVADDYTSFAADDEDAAYAHPHPRSTRHAR
ncbi:uncharacterized protein B0H64DRAFT_373221 [Chaetomium fimeti]|jgi:hypothetical protein|uniref:Uncharacterized protein n=1 Tax=Chaetomium fimeti TaxID=1854472 RepID=A0AAE0LUG2_9PEZI|nr:hypothetical protein B0H64DRAFT_373221 [Chaetomium fimeti]